MTQKRRNPGTQARATSTTPLADTDSSLYRRQDGYTAPTADERREAKLLAELRSLGYGITVPCLLCGHPLSAPRSLALHVGPRCRAKAATS